MDWFVFALLSPMMFGMCNILDKYVLTKKIRNPFSYNILCVALSIFPVLLLAFYLRLSLDLSAILAIFYGFVFAFLFVIYNKALMSEEASRIISMMRISPVFVLTLSFFFLNEILNYQKYLGVILLVSSAILVSYRKSMNKSYLSRGIVLILIFSFSNACMSIVLKVALGNIDYWSFFLWNLVGNLAGCFSSILLPSIRKNLIWNVSVIDRKTWVAVLFSDVFAWAGTLFYFLATSIGNVSLVSAVGSIQPLIVFSLALTITMYRPEFLKEEINRSYVLFKALAVVFIFVGSYLIVI